jgi:hypothetical protein
MIKAYEFTNLSIRPASDAFKTLSHLFQLVCTNATFVQEIHSTFDHRMIPYDFTHLNQVQDIPLNSIIGKFFKFFVKYANNCLFV